MHACERNTIHPKSPAQSHAHVHNEAETFLQQGRWKPNKYVEAKWHTCTAHIKFLSHTYRHPHFTLKRVHQIIVAGIEDGFRWCFCSQAAITRWSVTE